MRKAPLSLPRLARRAWQWRLETSNLFKGPIPSRATKTRKGRVALLNWNYLVSGRGRMSGFSIWNLSKIRLVCLQQLSQSPSLCQSSDQRAVVRSCIYCCAVLDTGHASKHLVLTVFIIMERLLIFIVAVVIIISCIFVFSRDVVLSTKHSLSLNGRRAEK